MKRFWISWYTKLDTEPETAWKWWVSGQTCTEPVLFTVVAEVTAKDKAEAKAKVLRSFPDAAELPTGFHFNGDRSGWRFCDEMDPHRRPGDGGRFV